MACTEESQIWNFAKETSLSVWFSLICTFLPHAIFQSSEMLADVYTSHDFRKDFLN